MRYLFFMICLLLPFSSIAEETEEVAKITYEVTISVTYNAVSLEEANRIMAKANAEHQGACRVEIGCEKNGGDLSIGEATTYVPDDGGGYVLTR